MPSEAGFNQWRQQRREAMRKLAREMGLPLEHQVEVWLRGGIRLRGMLRLREEMLFVEEKGDDALFLVIDGVSFVTSEMESCVRTDS